MIFNVKELTSFVKYQKNRVEKIIENHPDDLSAPKNLNPVISKYNDILSFFKYHSDVENEMIVLKEDNNRLKTQLEHKEGSMDSMSLRSDDFVNIPKKLLDQLSLKDKDRQGLKILEIFKKKGGNTCTRSKF